MSVHNLLAVHVVQNFSTIKTARVNDPTCSGDQRDVRVFVGDTCLDPLLR